MMLHQVDQFLRQEVQDLTLDPDNWDEEQTLGCCKICDNDIIEQERFRLFTELDGKVKCMNFHYIHALIETHWQAFQDSSIEGWIEA